MRGIFRLRDAPDGAGHAGERLALEILLDAGGVPEGIGALGQHEGHFRLPAQHLQVVDQLFKHPFAVGLQVLLQLVDHHQPDAGAAQQELPQFPQDLLGVQADARFGQFASRKAPRRPRPLGEFAVAVAPVEQLGRGLQHPFGVAAVQGHLVEHAAAEVVDAVEDQHVRGGERVGGVLAAGKRPAHGDPGDPVGQHAGLPGTLVAHNHHQVSRADLVAPEPALIVRLPALPRRRLDHRLAPRNDPAGGGRPRGGRRFRPGHHRRGVGGRGRRRGHRCSRGWSHLARLDVGCHRRFVDLRPAPVLFAIGFVQLEVFLGAQPGRSRPVQHGCSPRKTVILLLFRRFGPGLLPQPAGVPRHGVLPREYDNANT